MRLKRSRKYNWNTEELTEVWEGNYGEATHYIALSQDNSYLGVTQFADFFDEDNNLVPSKILILDMKTRKEFWIDNRGWSPSAHIDWDPVEPDVCYLSCHNGVITPVDNPVKFFSGRFTNGTFSGLHLFINTKSLRMARLKPGYSPILKSSGLRYKKFLCTGIEESLHVQDFPIRCFLRMPKACSS